MTLGVSFGNTERQALVRLRPLWCSERAGSVPIVMVGDERYEVVSLDAFDRLLCDIGVRIPAGSLGGRVVASRTRLQGT